MSDETTFARVAPRTASVEGLPASLLAVLPVDDTAKTRLIGLVGHASRHYHGLAHLRLLWRRHLQYAPEAGLDDPESCGLVGSAIAYHDAVFDGGRSDNERRSAELWLQDSASGAMSPDHRTWVADTILATADHLGYRRDIQDADSAVELAERRRLWMLDLDLTPLGEMPTEFDANAARLRAENADKTDEAFEAAQRAFLTRLAAAPRLYRTCVLSAVFEVQARRNLARRLGGR